MTPHPENYIKPWLWYIYPFKKLLIKMHNLYLYKGFFNLDCTVYILWKFTIKYFNIFCCLMLTQWYVRVNIESTQGYNARKVITETDVEAWHGIHLSHKKSMKYSGYSLIEMFYVNYQNFQNSMLLSSSDTKRTLRHLFLFTNSAKRELVS